MDGTHENMTELMTTAEVIEALGGLTKTATLTSRKYTAVQNWKNFVKFPSDTYVVMQDALRAGGYIARPGLWGMVPAPPTRPDQERSGASAQ